MQKNYFNINKCGFINIKDYDSKMLHIFKINLVQMQNIPFVCRILNTF